MANIFDAIGKAGELWTYGPHAVAEEKRRQEEHGANVDYRKAMADYYRQGGSRRDTKDKVASLTEIANAVTSNILTVEEARKKVTEMLGIETPPVTEAPSTEEKPGLWSRIFGGNKPETKQSPEAQNWQAVKGTAPQIANSWLSSGDLAGSMPSMNVPKPPVKPGIFDNLSTAIKSGGYAPGFRGFGAGPTVNTPMVKPQATTGGALGGLTSVQRPPSVSAPTTPTTQLPTVQAVQGEALTGTVGQEQSPYPDYPDAFLEQGVWKVMRNGKKYRIEE